MQKKGFNNSSKFILFYMFLILKIELFNLNQKNYYYILPNKLQTIIKF